MPGRQVPLDIFGLHQGSRTRTGREQRRAPPTERMNVIVPALGPGNVQILAGNLPCLQQKTDLEHLVQSQLVNSRQNHCGRSVAFESTVFVVAPVSVHAPPTFHFDEHTRTLKRLKWVERREPKPSTRFAASATPTPKSRKHEENTRKIGKAPHLWGAQ